MVAAAAEWKDDPLVHGHQELRANQVVAPCWGAFPEAADDLVQQEPVLPEVACPVLDGRSR